MQYYYDKETAPLRFHQIFIVLNCLAIPGQILRFFSLHIEIGTFSWLYTVDIAYGIISLVLAIIRLVGLIDLTSYGWYALMASYGLIALYLLYLLVIYAIFLPEEIGTVIAQFILLFIIAPLIIRYYLKRKPLFFNQKDPNEGVIAENSSLPNTMDTPNGPDTTVIVEDEIINLAVKQSPPSIIYCRICGHKLHPDSEYCSKCGAKIIKE